MLRFEQINAALIKAPLQIDCPAARTASRNDWLAKMAALIFARAI